MGSTVAAPRPEHDTGLDGAAERLFLESSDHGSRWRGVTEAGRRRFRRLAAATLGVPLPPGSWRPGSASRQRRRPSALHEAQPRRAEEVEGRFHLAGAVQPNRRRHGAEPHHLPGAQAAELGRRA
jgi:hypothetical protein